MNIGIISHGYPPYKIGGAELQAKALAKKLSAKNHKVILFTGFGYDEIEEENKNLRIIKIKYLDYKVLRIFLSQLLSFVPRIKEEASNLDVLLCYQVNPPGVVGLYCKLRFKIPLATCVRASTEYKSFLRKFIFTPVLLRYSDLFIVQSVNIKKDLANLSIYKLLFKKERMDNIRIIPNGIDLIQSYENNLDQRAGILFVGRLHKSKGIEYLIKAMQGIKEKLLIIGEGREKRNLERISRSLRMNIEFLDELPQKDVFNYMKKAKILILPSLNEAFPNVVLEAMNHGLPVIATEVGGVMDVIKHGNTGFLVKPKSYEQIHKQIKVLLEAKDLWKDISKNCLQEIKKYSWDNVIEKYEKALIQVAR